MIQLKEFLKIIMGKIPKEGTILVIKIIAAIMYL